MMIKYPAQTILPLTAHKNNYLSANLLNPVTDQAQNYLQILKQCGWSDVGQA